MFHRSAFLSTVCATLCCSDQLYGGLGEWMRSDYTFGVTFSWTPLSFPLQFNFLSSDFDRAGSEAVDSQRDKEESRGSMTESYSHSHIYEFINVYKKQRDIYIYLCLYLYLFVFPRNTCWSAAPHVQTHKWEQCLTAWLDGGDCPANASGLAFVCCWGWSLTLNAHTLILWTHTHHRHYIWDP